MHLHEQRLRGIVEVMDDEQTQERSISLGSALERLSAARQARGPVGVLDPFEIVPVEARRSAGEPPRAMKRRGLFRFSDRAREAADVEHHAAS